MFIKLEKMIKKIYRETLFVEKYPYANDECIEVDICNIKCLNPHSFLQYFENFGRGTELGFRKMSRKYS